MIARARLAVILQGAAGIFLAVFLSLPAHAANTCQEGYVAKVSSRAYSIGGRNNAMFLCEVGDERPDIDACFADNFSVPLTHRTWDQVNGVGTASSFLHAEGKQRKVYAETLVDVDAPDSLNNGNGTADIFFSCVVPSTPTDPCGDKEGQSQSVNFSNAFDQNEGCFDGCKVSIEGAPNIGMCVGAGCSIQQKYAVGTHLGESCETSTPTVNPATEKTLPDGSQGVCSADGKNCISKTKKNCGYVNGEYRCITASQLTPENPCVSTASGAQFCIDAAATPPKPDNGTPGTPANPDQQFELTPPGGTSTSTVNYYNSNTVNNDSNSPGGDGDGEGEGEGLGDCGDESKPCKVEVDEEGTPESPEEGAFDDRLPDFEEAESDLTAAAAESPADGFGDEILDSIGVPDVGSCQSLTFNGTIAAYVAARTAVWAFKWAMNIQLQGALSA